MTIQREREREKEGEKGSGCWSHTNFTLQDPVRNTENSEPGYSVEESIAFAKFCEGHKAQSAFKNYCFIDMMGNCIKCNHWYFHMKKYNIYFYHWIIISSGAGWLYEILLDF